MPQFSQFFFTTGIQIHPPQSDLHTCSLFGSIEIRSCRFISEERR